MPKNVCAFIKDFNTQTIRSNFQGIPLDLPEGSVIFGDMVKIGGHWGSKMIARMLFRSDENKALTH